MKHYNHRFIYKQDLLSLKALVRNTRKKEQIRNQYKEAEKIIKKHLKQNPSEDEGYIECLFSELTSPEISPMRFVYHLTDTKNRLSIARLGLQITNSKRSLTIYANNQHYLDFMTFYPFYCYSGNPVDIDVWRIDTSLINAKWYMDPFLCNVKIDSVAPYILTKENIPPTALRLFKAVPTKVSTTDQQWLHLGSLEISEIRLIEHAPTARLMDRLHYDCSKKLMAA